MFKKKAIILSSVAGALALVYALTFVFDAERSARRQASYRWLDPQSVVAADRIEARGSDVVNLEKAGDTWFVVYEDKRYPAKQSRVDELFTALTKPGAYAARGSSPEIQEKLGLTDAETSSIPVSSISIFSGGDTLITLLVGAQDASGSSIHLRKRGDDTVRGGEDRFSTFTSGSRASWQDLRLFPDENGVKLIADSVQRFTVFPPPDEEGNARPHYTLVRDGTGWKAETAGMSGEPKIGEIDAYIRGIVDAVGEDFAPGLSPGDEGFTDSSALSRVTLELGDGSTRTLYRGPDFSGKKTLALSGSPYVWLLSEWVANRIFRAADGLFSEEAGNE